MKYCIQLLSLWSLLSADDNLSRILPTLLPITVANAQLLPEAIANQPDLESFSTALTLTNLNDILTAAGPFSAFVPNDDAFSTIDSKYFEPEWTAHLTEIVLQHIVEGTALFTLDWQVGNELTPLSGGGLTISSVDPYILNDLSTVVTQDIVADNGVIQIMNAVILPPSAQDSIMDIILVIPEFFSTLSAMLVRVGLDEVLQGEGPYTMFAPSNAAFEALPSETLELLETDDDYAREVLSYHIVPGIFLVESLQQEEITTLATLQGTQLSKPAETSIQFVDLLATNGVMHIVTEVFLPPPPAPTISPSPTALPSIVTTTTPPAGATTIVPTFSATTLPPATSAPIGTILPTATGTLINVAIRNDLSTFVAAANETTVYDTLEAPGSYTVLAPPDDGFDAMPSKYLEDPDTWAAHLDNVMKFNVINGIFLEEDMTLGASMMTLTFNNVTVTSVDPLQVNDVTLIQTDIPANNGYLHITEQILLPPTAVDTAFDLVGAFDQFTIFFDLLQTSGMARFFEAEGPLTAFVPVDTAFDNLPDGITLEQLSADPLLLQNVLLYHLAPELLDLSTLQVDTSVTSFQSSDIAITIPSDTQTGFFANDAEILFRDLLVRNGYVQVIGSVLIPPLDVLTTIPPTQRPSVSPAPTIATTDSGTFENATLSPDVTDGPSATMLPSDTIDPSETIDPTLIGSETIDPSIIGTGTDLPSDVPETISPTIDSTDTPTEQATDTDEPMTDTPSAMETSSLTEAPTAGATPAVTTGVPTTAQTLVATTDAPTPPATQAETTMSPTAVETDAATTMSPTMTQTESSTTVAPTVMQTEAATTVAPTVMQTEAATTGAPTVMQTEAATTEAPTVIQTEAPTTGAPTVTQTEAATTGDPTVVVTETEGPATEGPETEAPATEAPETVGPTTDAPVEKTEAPETEVPTTGGPETEKPATEAPETEEPATEGPSREIPETEAPATEAPETVGPTTGVPVTEGPKTEVPSATEVVTTLSPTAAQTETVTTLSPSASATKPLTEVPSTGPSADQAIELPSEIPSSSPSLEVSSVTPSQAGSSTIIQLLQNDPSFSILYDLLVLTGLNTTLSGPGPFTVFGPNNDAFAKLPDGLLDTVQEDQESFTNVLLYHVSSLLLLSTDLQDGAMYPTVQGNNVTANLDPVIMINDAVVVDADIMASNGVIHEIDTVLLPPVPAETTSSPTTSPLASLAPTKSPLETLAPSTTSPLGTLAPSSEGECITVPGVQVCCPPGQTDGIYFFCRYV